MSFARYPKYKPSGVEWLGEVPERWEVLPIRKVARLESGHTPSRNHPEYWVDCTVPWFSLADVWQIRQQHRSVITETSEKVSELGIQNSAARRLPAGTVMLSRTASVGFAAIMGLEMATTQDFANWVCGERLLPHFLLNSFRAMTGEFRRLMMGSTHNTIYMPDIAALRLALPSTDEQRQIVTFLDRETAKIDALVAEQERLIELLKEKRQAVISQAVTKGLNPEAPMKDSGIKWVGEIPSHWTACPLKSLIGPVDQGWSPNCLNEPAGNGEWGVLKVGCGNSDRFDESENKSLPSDLEVPTQYEIHEGDILVSRGNTPSLVGMATLVPPRKNGPRLALSDLLYRFRVRDGLDPAYLVFLLRSPPLRSQIEAGATGTSQSMKKISQPKLGMLQICVPPLDEAVQISRKLNELMETTDALVDAANAAIRLLLERRASLVSAAVSGQIDVRPESMRTAT